MNLHPEIRKFWEDHYKKDILENVNPKYYYLFPLGGMNGVIIIAMPLEVAKIVNNDNSDLSKFSKDELVYFWKGLYTEIEMLKLIKLKAFL